jgi:hypothetical protein
LQKISEHHTGLGEMLENSIKTGLSFVYLPRSADAVSWRYSVEREAPAPVVPRFAKASLDTVTAQTLDGMVAMPS